MNASEMYRFAYIVLITYICTSAVDARARKFSKKAEKCLRVNRNSKYSCLIFEDNFNTLDLDTWKHDITASGGGNWEFQYYTNNRSNSYTRDGKLFIKPTLTADKYGESFLTTGKLDLWGGTPASRCTNNAFYGCERTGSARNIINPVQSAKLLSLHSFNFRYGRVEVRAKMPRGDWIWPAIWMLPTNEDYGSWPASGEIDLVEGRGNRNLKDERGKDKGVNSAGSTLHWGPYFPHNGYEKTTGERHSDYGDAFHTFGLEWDQNSLRVYIDNDTVLNVNPPAGGFWEMGNFGLPEESNPWRYSKNQRLAPFDSKFYLILNVAVGGTNGYFSDGWKNEPYPKPWSNPTDTAFRDFWAARDHWYPTWNPKVSNGEDAAMQVDYIRVWRKISKNDF